MTLGLISLAACGSDAGAGLDAVEISAEAGKAPEVDYGKDFGPDDVELKVLTKGDGETVGKDDAAQVHVWIGNSRDDSVVLDTYAEGQAALDLVVADVVPGLKKAVEGQKVGSVVAVAGKGSQLFSEYGYPEWGIGNGDPVVIRAEIVKKYTADEQKKIRDEQKNAQEQAEKAQKDAQAAEAKKQEVVESALPKATGTPVKKAGWAPKVDYGKDVPAIDFSGTPKPTGKLQVTELIKGKGKKVQQGDVVAVKYVGQVHGSKEPFDSSYSRNQDLAFTANGQEMIKGFEQAIVGRTVGSRVIVQIPPALGYGDKGVEGTIKGTDTIVFSIDIVGAG